VVNAFMKWIEKRIRKRVKRTEELELRIEQIAHLQSIIKRSKDELEQEWTHAAEYVDLLHDDYQHELQFHERQSGYKSTDIDDFEHLERFIDELEEKPEVARIQERLRKAHESQLRRVGTATEMERWNNKMNDKTNKYKKEISRLRKIRFF